MKSKKIILMVLFNSLLFLGFIYAQSNSIFIDHNNGNTTVQLDGEEAGGGGQMVLSNASGTIGMQLDAQGGAEESAFIQLFNPLGNSSMLLYSDFSEARGSRVYLQNDEGRPALVLDAQQGAGNGSGIELFNYAGQKTILIDAESGAEGKSTFTMNDRAGNASLLLYSDVTEARGSRVYMKNDEDRSAIILDAQQGAGNGSGIELFNYAGQRTILIDAENGANGPALISVDGKLIIEGADFSENFVITKEEGETVEAGTLLSIDPNQQAKLKPTNTAYCKSVIGVVSGAGGVRTGMLMEQKGTLASGDTPVAMSGRVYVQADATKQAIQPGDLLTSSSIEGHVMKVKNHRKAKGAVIGKALTTLEKGKTGMVLIVISLQ